MDPSTLTEANIETFKAAAFYIPLVVIVSAFLVFAFKVSLSEKRHDEIVSVLEKKLEESEHSK